MKFTDKELILFDLDGTLIDSVPDLALAVNEMLTALGRDTFTEDIIRYWVGNGAQTLVKRALSGSREVAENIDEKLFNEALNIFLGFYRQHLCADTHPYPHVAQTLQALKEKGYRLGIVTNKPYEFVGPILTGLKLTGVFESYLGGNSLERKKPDPLPLLHICRELGVSVDASVIVGDSRNDILAANAAGMQSIGVTYGYNYGEDIAVYEPDAVVNDFGDILPMFEAVTTPSNQAKD